MAEIENVPSTTQTSATPSGQRRRHHSDTGEHSAGDVDDDLRGRQRLGTAVQRRAEEERPERGREAAPGGVDGPVGTGPGPVDVRRRRLPGASREAALDQLDPRPG